MKKFKQFIKDKEPVLVTAEPCHGKHARDPKKKEKIEEKVVWAGKKTANPPTIKERNWLDHHDNVHLGENHQAVDKKIGLRHDAYDNTPGIEGVRKYTRKSIAINNGLIHAAQGKYGKDSGLGSGDFKKMVKEPVRQIDKALNHHSLDHDLHVYHGTYRFNPGKLASQHPDRKIKFPSYTSTSIDKRTASGFSDNGGYGESHILHIHLKKGQKGIYAGEHGHHGNEYEFLLPRNTTLKVHHEPTVLNNGTKVWHAHVTDD